MATEEQWRWLSEKGELLGPACATANCEHESCWILHPDYWITRPIMSELSSTVPF